MKTEQIEQVDPRQIVRGDNDRTEFDDEAIEQLAQDIALQGQQQPGVLRRLADGRLQLVAGERRWRACLYLLDCVPADQWQQFTGTYQAVLREMTDAQADAVMLSENLKRKDLNPVEEARAYQKRMQKYGWDVEQACQAIGVKKHRLLDRLELLKLIPEVQHLVGVGQFPLGHAVLMGVLNKNYQLIALKLMREKRPNQYEFGKIVGQLEAAQGQMTMFDDELFYPAPVVNQMIDKVMQGVPQMTSFQVALNGVTIGIAVEHLSDQKPRTSLSPEKQRALYQLLFS